MEIKTAAFTAWRWQLFEARLALTAESYDVSMAKLSIRNHWFLKKTIEYELHGTILNIARFVNDVLNQRRCLRIAMPKSLSRRLGKP